MMRQREGKRSNRRVCAVVVLLLLLLGGTCFFPVHPVRADYDLGGRTVRLAIFPTEITPMARRGEKDMADPEGRLAVHINDIEEMFNVQLDIWQHPSHGAVIEDITTDVLTGDPSNHVYSIRRDEMIPLAADGFLYPLDEALEPDFYQKLPRMFRYQQHGKFLGETYIINALKLPPTPMGVVWNKDIFEEEGLPDLYELYEEGAWDWDSFLKIARQVTRDTTGDGEIDRWGVPHTSSSYGSIITEMATTNLGSWTREVDGRIQVSFTESAFLEAAEFVRELYQEQQPPAGGWGAWLEFTHEQSFAMFVNPLRSLNWPDLRDHADFEAGIVPLPMGPRAEDHVYPSHDIWGVGMPVTIDEPGAVMEIVKALYMVTSDYKDIEAWEDSFWEEWTMYVHDRESLEIMRHVYASEMDLAAPYWSIIATDELHSAIHAVVTGEEAAGPAFEVIRPVIQARLDDLLQ